MKTTIIILNWNGREDTVACVASVLAAGVPLSDLLVVDNCSDDGSVEALAHAFPGLEILSTSQNLGYTGGNNVGIRHALASGSDAILLLNNDTEVASGFLSPLLEAFQKDPLVGVAGSLILFHGTPDIIWFGEPQLNPATGRIWDKAYGKKTTITDQPFEAPFVSGCAMAVSRTAVEKIGLLDEDFFCYAEELDICLRARSAGFKILIVPESKVYHKISGSTGGKRSGRTMYYRVRNLLLCMRKNLPLSSPLAAGMRNVSIIAIHVAAIWRLDMHRLEAIRALVRGVNDYFSRRFGKVNGLW